MEQGAPTLWASLRLQQPQRDTGMWGRMGMGDSVLSEQQKEVA